MGCRMNLRGYAIFEKMGEETYFCCANYIFYLFIYDIYLVVAFYFVLLVSSLSELLNSNNLSRKHLSVVELLTTRRHMKPVTKGSRVDAASLLRVTSQKCLEPLI